MKQIKKIVTLIGITLALFIFANTSWATITLSQNSGYSYSDGGEFKAVTTGQEFVQNYATPAKLGDGFETFCVEAHVEFYPNQPYNFTVSSVDSEGRYLSIGAAYLYYQFSQGTLNGYNYNGDRASSAGALQQAIWYLQGGQTHFGTPTVDNNIFYKSVYDMFGNGATDANNGQYGVSILRLTDNNGNAAQNQLVVTGVPEPTTIVAGALMLLPLGLSTIRVLRKQNHA